MTLRHAHSPASGRCHPGAAVRPFARQSGWAALAIIVLLLAACSGSDGATGDAPIGPTAVPAPGGVGAGGELLSLEVVELEPGFALVTDYRGFAVYGASGETPDSFICADPACVASWIPVAPRDAAVSERLDPAQFTIITRPDGSPQVAYNSVPLYTWTGDTAVGIAAGAGVAGVWFALNTEGERFG